MKQTITSSVGKVRSGKRQKGREKRRAWKQKRNQETTARKNQDEWSHWEACAKQNHQTSHENTIVKSVRKPKLDTSFERRKAPKKNYQSIGERKQRQHGKYWARESTCKLKQYQFLFVAEWPMNDHRALLVDWGRKGNREDRWKSRRSIEIKEEEFFRNARQAQTGARHLGIDHRQGKTSKALDKKQMDGWESKETNERKSDGKNKQTKESMT